MSRLLGGAADFSAAQTVGSGTLVRVIRVDGVGGTRDSGMTAH